MNHRRWINRAFAIVLVVQCPVFLLLAPGNITFTCEMLGGLLLLWILITGFTQKIVTYSDSFAISGFYIGLAKATVLVDDLISVKYQFLVPAGRSFYVSVFSLRARSAPDDFFQIPTYGWSHNRDLFRSIAEMVSGSGIPMDAKTARKLTAISGVVVVPRKVVTRQVAEGATR